MSRVVILVEVQCLYGKSSRLIIYVRGDGRLKLSKQLTINTNPTFYPQTLVHASVIRRLRVSSSSIENRAKSGQIRLSSANRRRLPLAGSLPRNWDVLFQKAPTCCLTYRDVSQPPMGRVAEYLPRHRGYTRTCSCDAFLAQHTFWRLRWGQIQT